jgi:hypothetical protein
MVAVSMFVVVAPVTFVGVLVDPAPDINGLARWIEQGRPKERIRHNLAVCYDVSRCSGIERNKLPLQILNRRRRCKITLCE